jgi:hypothetical protein
MIKERDMIIEIPAWKMEVSVYGWYVPVLRFWDAPKYTLAE